MVDVSKTGIITFVQNFQLDMKAKMVEAKFQEEKLRLQQKHDSTVQKVGCL